MKQIPSFTIVALSNISSSRKSIVSSLQSVASISLARSLTLSLSLYLLFHRKNLPVNNLNHTCKKRKIRFRYFEF
jgi:hypothetical protein